jgi:mRNA interferase MazF
MSGDFGKPRPAIVIQTDCVAYTDTVLICMITSDLTQHIPFRVNLPSNPQTGLKKPSQIMAEKTHAVWRSKCGPVFGHVGEEVLGPLKVALELVMGFNE